MIDEFTRHRQAIEALVETWFQLERRNDMDEAMGGSGSKRTRTYHSTIDDAVRLGHEWENLGDYNSYSVSERDLIESGGSMYEVKFSAVGESPKVQDIIRQALAKLTDEDRKALGLDDE